jgi:hypothetical protein
VPPPWPRALAGQPEDEAACADAAPDFAGLEDLHIALATAAAHLDDAIAEHTGILHPLPPNTARDAAPPARTLRTQKRKGARVSPRPRHYRLLYS